MCGIAGKLTWHTPAQAHTRLMHAMTARMQHRGPDDQGFYSDQRIALGHCRLAVIDTSPAGRQPIANEDGTVRALLNGEIYNYPDLRKRLVARGHTFRSQTDTEVLVHLYEDEGPGFLDHLRGMFALAIWDSARERLLLARDRVGKKPLVYSTTSDSVVFASEIKALLCDPSVDRRLEPTAIHQYLSYQYVPTPRTIFRAIRKLPPAHVLVAERGHVSIDRYWQARYEPKLDLNEIDATDHLDALVRKAVGVRLLSDVPVGTLLSGGVDSSLVTAMMASLGVSPLRAFSIGFGEPRFDELPYARAVAQQLGAEHHELRLDSSSMEAIPNLIAHFDEPFADVSAIPTLLLSRMAREHVTVALSGDGGDETFAGYERYTQALADDRWRAVPGPARRAVANLAAATPLNNHDGRFARRVRHLGRSTDSDVGRYFSLLSYAYFDEPSATLYTPEFARAAAAESSLAPIETAMRSSDAQSGLDTLLAIDMGTYLPDDVLTKMDRASMAHSLEVRSPLLDHTVVEFAARLPVSMKVHGAQTKFLLKQVARRYLPDAIVDRPKVGFAVPLDAWFRADLRMLARDVLLDSRATARGLFRADRVARLIGQHTSGKAEHGARLWTLTVLELWCREFVDAA